MPIETLSPSPVSCGSVEQLASTNCKQIPVRHILWNRTNCSMAKFMSKRCLRCWTKNNFFTFFTLSIVQELVDRIRWGRSYLLTKRSYRLSIQFIKFRSLLQKSEKIILLLKRVPRLQQLFWGDFASGCGRAEFPGSNLVSGNFFHQLLTEKRSGKKETWNGTFKSFRRYFYFIAFGYQVNAWTWVESQVSPLVPTGSVTRKKSPNVYKSCPKMITLEKW